jgi:hypothetical protein
MTLVTLSLISHTNVGKTTLARTLLRRDVGEVRDESHVTLTAERYTLLETPDGDLLELWDTPGFGDSVRLARRLEQSSNPLGWFLTQVWDRFADRAFFSSQQALRNVREHADVVLYLVNAMEDSAAYVEPELRILGWLDKPVIVLLNQLGPPDAAREAQDLSSWQRRTGTVHCVRDVLAFDAFARCWVHEHVLFERIAAALSGEPQAAFLRLNEQWQTRNRAVFERSMQVLARQLAAAALDCEPLTGQTIGATIRNWFGSVLRGMEGVDRPSRQAMAMLAERLDSEVRTSTDELIVLHGLSGQASTAILNRLRADFQIDRALDPDKASVVGAAVSGALGGLAADLAAGGLTLGAGALLGGLLGAAGSRGLALAYNTSRGVEGSIASWSAEFLQARLTAAILRYLAVAHFGRGRGDFAHSESPSHWRTTVEQVVAARTGSPQEFWLRVRGGAPGSPTAHDRSVVAKTLDAELGNSVAQVFEVLYPHGP